MKNIKINKVLLNYSKNLHFMRALIKIQLHLLKIKNHYRISPMRNLTI